MQIADEAPPLAVVQGIGGLSGMGSGIADYRAWIVAGVVLILLAALAWWTLKPAGRVDRPAARRAGDSRAVAPTSSSTEGDPPGRR